MEGLISIIVPVFKVPEHMLRNCVKSCINQTFENIEVILVDDGSPDNCGKICDEYAHLDKRIKVIHQKNKGLSGARNTGQNAANGECIMFLDGDDYIKENMCEVMYNIFKENKVQIVCCTYVKKHKAKEVICNFRHMDAKKYTDDECKFLQEKVLDFNAHFSTAYCKLIDRRFLIRNNIYHNEELRQGAEGIEFNIRLFENITSAQIIDEPFYYYMYNEESISNKHDVKNHYYVLKCFEKIKEEILNSKNKKKLLELFYNRMVYVVVTTAISGYFSTNNKETFKIKKSQYCKYLQEALVQETIKFANLKKIDYQRKIIFLLIKHSKFRFINLLSYIRKKMK